MSYSLRHLLRLRHLTMADIGYCILRFNFRRVFGSRLRDRDSPQTPLSNFDYNSQKTFICQLERMISPNILGLLGSIGFGTSDFLVRLLSKKNNPIALLFWSQLLGGIFLLPFILFEKTPITFTKVVLPALFLGFFDLIASTLLYTALSKGKASVITPILSSFVAVSVIFSFLVFKESLNLTQLIVTIFIFIGVLLLSFEFTRRQKTSPKLLSGVPEAILATIIIGIYIPTWGKLVQNDNWLATITIVRLTIPIIIFVVHSLRSKMVSIPAYIKPSHLLIISAVNTLAQIGSSIAFNTAPKVAVISIILATSPLITISLASLFLSEKLNRYQKIGVALTSIGTIYLSSR